MERNLIRFAHRFGPLYRPSCVLSINGEKPDSLWLIKAKSSFLLASWRAFFVSFVIQVGHVRWNAPSFHSLLPRICIQLAAKTPAKVPIQLAAKRKT
jgi:hypothetical protein